MINLSASFKVLKIIRDILPPPKQIGTFLNKEIYEHVLRIVPITVQAKVNYSLHFALSLIVIVRFFQLKFFLVEREAVLKGSLVRSVTIFVGRKGYFLSFPDTFISFETTFKKYHVITTLARGILNLLRTSDHFQPLCISQSIPNQC